MINNCLLCYHHPFLTCLSLHKWNNIKLLICVDVHKFWKAYNIPVEIIFLELIWSTSLYFLIWSNDVLLSFDWQWPFNSSFKFQWEREEVHRIGKFRCVLYFIIVVNWAYGYTIWISYINLIQKWVWRRLRKRCDLKTGNHCLKLVFHVVS